MSLFSKEMLSVLPVDSRAKIARLDADRDDAHAKLLTATERWQAAHLAYEGAFGAAERAKAAVERLSQMWTTGIGKRLSEAETAEARKAAADATAKAEALKADLDFAAAQRDRATDTYRGADFLSEVAKHVSVELAVGSTFTHVPAAAPKGVKDHRAAVAAIREELATIEREWQDTERAPALAADLRAAFLAAVDRIAADGEPKIVARMRHGADPIRLAGLTGINLRTYGADLPVQTPELAAHMEALKARATSSIDTRLPAFLVWLLQPEIEDRIGTLISAVPQDGALSDAARDERFEALAAKRLDLERREEALISQAEAAGTIIPRRRSADARAVAEIA